MANESWWKSWATKHHRQVCYGWKGATVLTRSCLLFRLQACPKKTWASCTDWMFLFFSENTFSSLIFNDEGAPSHLFSFYRRQCGDHDGGNSARCVIGGGDVTPRFYGNTRLGTVTLLSACFLWAGWRRGRGGGQCILQKGTKTNVPKFFHQVPKKNPPKNLAFIKGYK